MRAILLRPKAVGLLLLAVFLAVFPFLHEWPFFSLFLGEFRTFNATMFAVWLLILLGMNLLTGYSDKSRWDTRRWSWSARTLQRCSPSNTAFHCGGPSPRRRQRPP